MIPIRYNLRSLFVRKSTTILTICSTGATVAVLAGLLSLQQGFSTMFTQNGRQDLAIFLRPGATSEGESSIRREQADILIKSSPEIKLGKDGQPLASGEVYLAMRRRKMDGGEVNVPIRGVQPRTFDIHGESFKILEGESIKPGQDELIVGKVLVGRIQGCQLGATMRINTVPFRVVGVFESKGGYQSEIWGDADRMLAALKRDNFSRVIGVLKDDAKIEPLRKRLENDKQIPAKTLDEQSYLNNQTGALTGTFIGLGVLLAGIMGLAAVFTGTNAMLSAIAARTGEIGILMSMGFRPGSIFLGFLMESVLIGFLGGLAGCLLVLPFNGMQTGTMNASTFTEVVFTFRTTPLVLGTAISFSVMLGLVGGAIPAWKASRLRPTEALRRG